MAEPASILIVDDEAPLLRLMQTYLERLGYRVTGCLDATQGLRRLEEAGGTYALVVADLSLPDLPGDTMALRMVKDYPELKVLLCSGYPFEVESLPEDIRHRFSALQKPFLPNMLAQEVETLLNRH